mgnify:CR=1 FL=1
MKRFKFLTVVMLVMVLSLAGNVAKADNSAQDSVKVRVTIPVMQKMKVINPITVPANLGSDLKSGKPVVINEAGTIKVMSNTSWTLKVDTPVNVYLRRSNKEGAEWKLASSRNSKFYGDQGRINVSFDIKIKPTHLGNYTSNQKSNFQIPFSYTLTQN